VRRGVTPDQGRLQGGARGRTPKPVPYL
jgi:hypothetical protein